MNNHKWKIIIGVVLVAVVLGLLFYWPRIGKPTVVSDVPCLVPNIPLTQHLHPVLKIYMDDKAVTVPANTGLSSTCEHATHTHDDTGMIHVEVQDAREYKLKDFYSVWGEQINKDGYKLEMTVDGKPFADKQSEPGELILKDKQEIVLRYTKTVTNP